MAPLWLASLWLAGCDDRDFDGDGYIEPTDCDDADPYAHPGAEEVPYDGKDQDCRDGDLVDRDGDGYQADVAGGPDCNDLDPTVFPGADETPYDGVDSNCDDWNDDDFDQDGFVAMGHGGDDCDDRDPRVTPLDLDGDGYSPCTGDCDEGDPLRNAAAEPICGNGFDDDCDDVSDCTPTGVSSLDELPIRIAAAGDVHDYGTRIVAPGDLDGDGVADLVVVGDVGPPEELPTARTPPSPDTGLPDTGLPDTGPDTAAETGRPDTGDGPGPELPPGGARLWVHALPLPASSDPGDAWATLTVPGTEPRVTDVGDVDGDGLHDLLVGDLSPDNRAWLVGAPPPGHHRIEDLARLELVATWAQAGRSATRIGDALVVGAPFVDTVQILPPDTTGTRAFGEDGARIVGAPGQGAGMAVLGTDTDGDGDPELWVAATGGSFPSPAGAYRVAAVPTSGAVQLEDRAEGSIDLTQYGQSTTELAAGDLDGDGRDDAVISVPFADGSTGAVLVLLEPPTSPLTPDDADITRLGIGDDTFGWTVLADDFDDDGADDLIVGAPAAWRAIGGAGKPGAVHLWYGPLALGLEHSITADLYLEGAYTGIRTYAGYGMALGDVDANGGDDLLVGSPNVGSGVVDVLPGGLAGLYGH